MRVQFTIGIDGNVARSTASGIGDAKLEQCVANVISGIEFPKSKRATEAVDVTYPIVFAP